MSLNADAHWLAASPPFAVFRNKELHIPIFRVDRNTYSSMLESTAWKQTLYYKSRLAEHPIPSYLLHDFIMQDLFSDKAASNRHNNFQQSMSYAQHDGRGLIVHSGGRSLEEVVVRPVESLRPLCHQTVPGFTLNVSHAVEQIERAGSSHWNTSSHLLCRSSTVLTHIRTVDAGDYEKAVFPKTITSTRSLPDGQDGCILEPLQKWLMPEGILSMATMSSSRSYAVLLSRSRRLFTWDPVSGVRPHGSDPVAPQDATARRVCQIAFSAHPQVIWISSGTSIVSKDLRSPGPAAEVYHSASPVVSLAQHGRSAHMLLAAHDPSVSLLDTRCGRSLLEMPLPHRSDGGGPGRLSYSHGSMFGDCGVGMYVG